MDDSTELSPLTGTCAQSPEGEGAPPADAPLAPHSGGSAWDEELVRLRSLLFQREIDLLENLNRKLADPKVQTEKVASVIAEAVAARAAKDDRLRISLEPMVEKIVIGYLRASPHEFANVFFPVMGPAIRKSIGESFRSMLQGFSKTMEMSFSWRGLRWRLDAMRTGQSFSEIVLMRTLVYRVEEIYFIHSATGITLMHEVNDGVSAQDEGMVSAMLTAVQDFVRDSFAVNREGELESLQHGEHMIIVEKQPVAYLACIVRGSPPLDFREQCRDCLYRLLVNYADALEKFDGDAAPFESGKILLTQLLQAHFVDDERGVPRWTKALIAALLLLGAAGVGWFQYREHMADKARLVLEENRRTLEEGILAAEGHRQAALRAVAAARWEALEVLRREPGLVAVNVRPTGFAPWEVTCLKDELARTPEAALRAEGHDPEGFSFAVLPNVSYDRNIVRRRVQAAIDPPPTVAVRFDDDGTLHLSGDAPMEWTLEARRRALALPGVKNVEVREVSDPRMGRLAAMTREVEGVSVEFPSGKDIPVPQDAPKLNAAVDTLAELEKLAADMGMSASLTVYGHADATGTDKRNYEISLARARTIAAMLYARGSSMPISLYGMGADYANREVGLADQASRRIELRVHLTQARPASLEEIPR
ncbi:MAG: OmpA family protein [Desulfovibrio sp.]|jgi:OOP family OmpA-OmpF porin|nr:OmpA family protein [Desulfovibrio sp.]